MGDEARWPDATFIDSASAISPIAEQIFERLDPSDVARGNGEAPSTASMAPLSVLVRGTNFQVRVWEALLRIPPGAVSTYEEIAGVVGQNGATRAVGSAIGKNPVAYLIPCHRVIRKTGAFGSYHWGAERKVAMLLRETAETPPHLETREAPVLAAS